MIDKNIKTLENEYPTSTTSSSSFCTEKINSSFTRQYPNFSLWRRDECRSCKCIKGHIKCFSEHCATENCQLGRWLSVKGRCCPLCADLLVNTHRNNICLYNEHAYTVGEHFQVIFKFTYFCIFRFIF